MISPIDPTDPASWGPAVDRVAESIANSTWGPAHWYRGAANNALSAIYEVDPKDAQRVLMVWEETNVTA